MHAERVFDINLSSPLIFVFEKCCCFIQRESLLMNVDGVRAKMLGLKYQCLTFFVFVKVGVLLTMGYLFPVHCFLMGPFLMSSFAGLTLCVPCLLN